MDSINNAARSLFDCQSQLSGAFGKTCLWGLAAFGLRLECATSANCLAFGGFATISSEKKLGASYIAGIVGSVAMLKIVAKKLKI